MVASGRIQIAQKPLQQPVRKWLAQEHWANGAEAGVQVLSDDTFSELVLPFTPELNFGYGEPRNAPETLEFSGALIVFMAEPPPTGDDVDTICFLEMPNLDLM